MIVLLLLPPDFAIFVALCVPFSSAICSASPMCIPFLASVMDSVELQIVFPGVL